MRVQGEYNVECILERETRSTVGQRERRRTRRLGRRRAQRKAASATWAENTASHSACLAERVLPACQASLAIYITPRACASANTRRSSGADLPVRTHRLYAPRMCPTSSRNTSSSARLDRPRASCSRSRRRRFSSCASRPAIRESERRLLVVRRRQRLRRSARRHRPMLNPHGGYKIASALLNIRQVETFCVKIPDSALAVLGASQGPVPSDRSMIWRTSRATATASVDSVCPGSGC